MVRKVIGGRYGHNNLVKSGGGCMHSDISSTNFLTKQLGTYLSSLGYRTGLFGKCAPGPSVSAEKCGRRFSRQCTGFETDGAAEIPSACFRTTSCQQFTYTGT